MHLLALADAITEPGGLVEYGLLDIFVLLKLRYQRVDGIFDPLVEDGFDAGVVLDDIESEGVCVELVDEVDIGGVLPFFEVRESLDGVPYRVGCKLYLQEVGLACADC